MKFFVRAECKITAYDSDRIFVKNFIEKYITFFHKRKAKNYVSYTKRAMVAMGVQQDRLSMSVIRSEVNKIILDNVDI